MTRDSKADWVKATLLTRQTTNLSDVKHCYPFPAVPLCVSVQMTPVHLHRINTQKVPHGSAEGVKLIRAFNCLPIWYAAVSGADQGG